MVEILGMREKIEKKQERMDTIFLELSDGISPYDMIYDVFNFLLKEWNLYSLPESCCEEAKQVQKENEPFTG